ncbi:hypothetical protein [Stenoxybacter acetivorans]|uniref:hypothetical protein n=1 Tax=Stenoxybacter acetivorans TaxID=422441 RepID=UPI0012EBE5EF|nr:hypothetical protein [Stenoxybacter acetivorans]
MKKTHKIQWDSNKKLSDLIAALQSFEDQNLEVLISVDGGQSTRPITFSGNKMGNNLINFALASWQTKLSPETGLPKASIPNYLACGKEISQLIEELKIYENEPDRIVKISVDDGDTCFPISRIEQRDKYNEGDHLACVLMFCPNCAEDEMKKTHRIQWTEDEIQWADDEMKRTHRTQWESSDKKLPDLIAALQSFEDQDLEVLISVDGGQSTRPITMFGNNTGCCLLSFMRTHWMMYVSSETGLPKASVPNYLARGKEISQVIDELKIWEGEPDRIIEISVDDGENCYPVSRIEHRDKYNEGDRLACVLMFCPS